MPPGPTGSVPPVQIRYVAIDEVTGPLAEMMASQNSFLGSLANLTLAAQGFGMAMGAANTVMRTAIGLNAEYEQSILTIAGNLAAFDLVPTFAAGKRKAEDLFGTIQKLAAALPGETEQYLQVFEVALPQALDSFAAQGGASLEEVAKFTSQWTAIAVSQGIDAAQAGRDLKQMLSGRAGLDVRSFSEMAGFLNRSAKELGYTTKLSTEMFNKLDEGARLKILQGTIKQFGPLLGNFANTTDALQGTLTSTAKEIGRAATGPLFNLYEDALRGTAAWLDANKAAVLEIAQTWGVAVVDGIKRAKDEMVRAFEVAKGIATTFKPVFDRMAGAVGGVGGALEGTFRNVVQPNLGRAGEALGAGGGVLGQLVGALAALSPTLTVLGTALHTLATTTGFADAMLRGFDTTMRLLAPIVEPFVAALRSAGELLGSLVATILPPLLDLFNTLLTPLSYFVQLALPALKDAFERLSPIINSIALNIIKFATGLAKFMSPLFQAVGVFGGLFVDVLLNVVIPAFFAVANALAILLGNVGAVLEMNENKAGLQLLIDKIKADRFGAQGTAAGWGFEHHINSAFSKAGSAFDKMFLRTVPEGYAKGLGVFHDTLDKAGAWLVGQAKAGAGPSTTKKQVLDFRGSQFNITQQFAEGFDPDRIAAVFAKDVSRLGEMRRQSGLAPLYAVR